MSMPMPVPMPLSPVATRTHHRRPRPRKRSLPLLLTLCILAPLVLGLTTPGSAQATPDPAMDRTWARTDYPVAQGDVSRTWMWGPVVRHEVSEPYAEAPGGQRAVVYFDKARMELTTEAGVSPDSPWYVTNGLLVTEMVTGQLQVGNSAFEPRPAAQINVAGDPDDTGGPTYATFAPLQSAAPHAEGATITARLSRSGIVTNDPTLATYGATAGPLVEVPGLLHRVASPFWAFMTSSGSVWQDGALLDAPLFENAYYATGYPISEAYWTTVRVAGAPRDVLVQCFQRRCLTWTPGNAPGWEVEAGNVGQHYWLWRSCEPTGPAVLAPDLATLPDWVSPDGLAQHGWDAELAAYVMRDNTPYPDMNAGGGYQMWWPSDTARPADGSLAVDIVTLTDVATWQAEAALFVRLSTDDSGPTQWLSIRLGMDGMVSAFLHTASGVTPVTEDVATAAFISGNGASNRLQVTLDGNTVRVTLNDVPGLAFMLPEGTLAAEANGLALAVFRYGPPELPEVAFGFRNLLVTAPVICGS